MRRVQACDQVPGASAQMHGFKVAIAALIAVVAAAAWSPSSLALGLRTRPRYSRCDWRCPRDAPCVTTWRGGPRERDPTAVRRCPRRHHVRPIGYLPSRCGRSCRLLGMLISCPAVCARRHRAHAAPPGAYRRHHRLHVTGLRPGCDPGRPWPRPPCAWTPGCEDPPAQVTLSGHDAVRAGRARSLATAARERCVKGRPRRRAAAGKARLLPAGAPTMIARPSVRLFIPVAMREGQWAPDANSTACGAPTSTTAMTGRG